MSQAELDGLLLLRYGFGRQLSELPPAILGEATQVPEASVVGYIRHAGCRLGRPQLFSSTMKTHCIDASIGIFAETSLERSVQRTQPK